MKKKARLGNDDATKQEIETLRQYILACPNVTKNGKAVQAALEGLDRELKRMERDTKLKQKFQQTTTSSSSTTTTAAAAASATARANNNSLYSSTFATEKDEFTEVNSSDFEANNSAVSQNKKKKSRDNDNDDDDNDEQLLMEWQNVHGDDDPIGSVLGTSLAQTAIQSIAERAVAVSSPLAALALALHAALVSDTLSFACTGVPEPTTTNNNNNSSSNKGFAPPIRELPKEKFLPNQWESPQHIQLRYRKPGVGTVVLSVALNDCNGSSNDPAFVTMEWIHKNEPSKSLRFALLDHINLDSITAALQKDVRVAPTLHYKALPILFTNFCNAFDLGTVREGAAATDVAMQMLGQGGRANHAPAVVSRVRPAMGVVEDRDPLRVSPFGRVVNEHEEPSMQVFEPRGGRGDFAGDLGPLGIMPMGGPPGNLLGPNHPMFGGNLGMGGRGMKPRFDPFGPPGGPTDPAFEGNLDPLRQRRRQGPGGSGNPNPDLLRPPNSFDNNNMYM